MILTTGAAPEGTPVTGHIDLAIPGPIRQDLALPPLTTLQGPIPTVRLGTDDGVRRPFEFLMEPLPGKGTWWLLSVGGGSRSARKVKAPLTRLPSHPGENSMVFLKAWEPLLPHDYFYFFLISMFQSMIMELSSPWRRLWV